ncbi:MAG: vitamin K epoxide reductase family protein [Patescibacteria group bacterium]
MRSLLQFVLKYKIQILSLIGIVVSLYLIYSHYTDTSLACPENSVINCANVVTSQYSTFFTLPLPVYGILYFIFSFVLAFIPKLKKLLFVVSIIALILVFRLVYIEIALIGSICIYCTSLHIIIFLIFSILLYDLLVKNKSVSNNP